MPSFGNQFSNHTSLSWQWLCMMQIKFIYNSQWFTCLPSNRFSGTTCHRVTPWYNVFGVHLALIITKHANTCTSCIDHISFKYVIRGHNWQPQDVTACVDNRVAPSVVIQGNLVRVAKVQNRSWGEAQGRDGSCPGSEYQELFKGFSTFIFCNANTFLITRLDSSV